MQMRINQGAVEIPQDLSTWGDLLDWLETDYLQSGQCITKVAFNEAEAARYREKDACGRHLSSLGRIDIESGDFDSVVRESMAELAAELDRVREAGGQIVRLFESRDQERAYQALALYLESLGLLFTIFSEELGWIHDEAGDARPALIAALEQALGQLVAAQENGFWISVCDVLEYEIAPVLDGWKTRVERTRAAIQ